jgi:DNA-binding MarR family transcriptional regulator
VTATPSGPDDSPGFLLWRATLRWQRAVTSALKPHELTHVQFVLLASTWWFEGEGDVPTQRRLADHAQTDVMMTSQVLRALESRGLVTREPDPRDTRARRVRLTAAGRRRVAQALGAVEGVDGDFFAAHPAGELLPTLRALAGEREGTLVGS